MIGEANNLPLPYIIFTTPFGKQSLKISTNGDINKTPCFAGLKTTVFPIIKAGINKAKVSFKG